jgi:hypothetical protein
VQALIEITTIRALLITIEILIIINLTLMVDTHTILAIEILDMGDMGNLCTELDKMVTPPAFILLGMDIITRASEVDTTVVVIIAGKVN